MQIIKDFYKMKSDKPTAVTIGKFEALHKGHQKLICEVASCRNMGLVPTVFSIKNPNVQKQFLENGRRMEFMERLGIELFVEAEFTKDFADMSAEDFIKNLVEKLSVRVIVTGEDFRFGKDRMGDKEMLYALSQKYGYEYRFFCMEKYNNKTISTTYAKELLEAHNYEKLNKILGYDYP